MINPDKEKSPEGGRIQFIRPLRDALVRNLVALGLVASLSFEEIEVTQPDYPEPQAVMYPPDPEPGSITNPIK